MARSETNTMVALVCLTGKTFNAFAAKLSQRSEAIGNLRWRLTTSIIGYPQISQITQLAKAPGTHFHLAPAMLKFVKSASSTDDTLHVALAGVLVVGLDNHLHQLMAHDIFFSEIDELDAIQIRQHALGFN